jgi:hypothetical protein
MITPYKDEFYWWELLVIFKKALISLTIFVFSASVSKVLKSFIMILIFFISLALETRYQPYKLETSNSLNSM